MQIKKNIIAFLFISFVLQMPLYFLTTLGEKKLEVQKGFELHNKFEFLFYLIYMC